MIRTLLVAAGLLLASPAVAWDPGLTACKHDCGQAAHQCKLSCREGNRSRCINDCEARYRRCLTQCTRPY